MEVKGRTFWPLLFGAISLIYVLLEFGFNANLVDLASSATLSSEELEHMARKGETLSGIGLAIALMTLLKRFTPLKDRGTFLSLALLIAMIAFVTVPFMKWAQPAFVDYLVDRTSAEDRSKALGLNLFKFGVANGAVQIKGQALQDSPQDKTLLALIGPMASGNTRIESIISSNRKQIFERVLLSAGNDTTLRRWNDYQNVREDVAAKYSSYVDSANKYQSSLLKASGKTGETLDAIRKGVEADYRKHLEDVRRFDAALLAEEQEINNQVRWSLNNPTIPAYRANYEKATKRIYGFVPNVEEYIVTRTATASDATTRNGNTLSINPVALLMNSVTDRKIRVISDESIHQGHLRMIDRAYAQQSSGIPRNLTLSQYMRQPQVCSRARAKVVSNGINLPGNWCPDNERAVMDSVQNEAQQRVQREWDKGTQSRFGQVVGADLSENQFRNLPAIRNGIAKALAGAPCTRGNAYLSAAQFKSQCIAPELNKRRDELSAAFSAPVDQLADGGTQAQKGRQAVKALIIPPVAMALSLFFSLLAAINLLLKLLPGNPLFRGKVVRYGGVAVLLLLPAFGSAGKHDAMAQLILGESKSFGILYSWVLNAEPAVYRFGQALIKPSKS
ncbi:hypothetical protein ACNFH5_22635 [Pseudomonas sp. NY15435]|uniref:hypothetical protein n=1 Tax=Pseudomonas sp. NY15435 TaxID=3400358 RepID=UPI003A8B07E6